MLSGSRSMQAEGELRDRLGGGRSRFSYLAHLSGFWNTLTNPNPQG
jgi:hypothetical protein